MIIEPQVKAFSSEVACTLGANVSLHCQGTNVFPVDETYFYWMFKGETSFQNPRWYTYRADYNPVHTENPSVVNFSLLIMNVSSADLGTYTCFADPLHGTYNDSMYLQLESEGRSLYQYVLRPIVFNFSIGTAVQTLKIKTQLALTQG